MFDKIKGLMDMQKKMNEIKKELDKSTFQIESEDGSMTITMNGSQQVQEVVVKADNIDVSRLGRVIKDTVNRAIKRSHEVAADKMKDVTGLNLPGL